MKSFVTLARRLFFPALLLGVLIFGTTPAQAATTNLIANPSVETVSNADSTLPLGWTHDSWGTNAVNFSYDTTGHTGSRSLSVHMTSYASGDAKWYFSPVAAQAATGYNFSDYYKSDVATNIVARFDDGSGNYTYQYLGTAAPNTAWTQYTISLTTAANTQYVTIFHLIAAVGTLSIDDAALTTDAPSPAPSPTPVSANLLANSSLETAGGTNTPQGWTKDAWGTSSHAFSYDTTGHTGSRSATVTMTSYTSGDAKWYDAPVAVAASSPYTYADYYQSDVATNIVARFDDGSGNYTYQYLGTAAPSITWNLYSVDFTTPGNAASATILHVLAAVGSLSVDDVSLVADSAAQPSPTPPVVTPRANLVPNASVETVGTAQAPQGWYAGSYGNNTTVFTYETNLGHSGSHSVRTTMTNFVDGGANWTYDAPAVEAGKTYSFSDYYQSNVSTQALVAVKLSNGTTQYLWLGAPYASDGAWTHFFATFTMPANAVSAVAYQSLSANGYFVADDYALQPYASTTFNAPLVTVTFDDGLASQYVNGLPIMRQYGLTGTYYIISGLVNDCDPTGQDLCYMTGRQVQGLYGAGNEIGSHTVTHPDLTSLTTAQVDQELSASQASLQQLVGVPVTDFAAPYGAVNLSVLTEVQKYYASQRGVQVGYNSIDNYNPQNLVVQDINSSATVADVQSYIDHAKATNTWLILMYHDINADMTLDSGYDTTPADFQTEMAYLKASGIAVQLMNQALQTVAAQVQ